MDELWQEQIEEQQQAEWYDAETEYYKQLEELEQLKEKEKEWNTNDYMDIEISIRIKK
jgi:hypothetical protein